MKLKYLTASVLALSCMSALAQETAELRVTGKILPKACVPSFTGGGVVDYGNIGAGTLSDTDFTVLYEEAIGFTLDCGTVATTAGVQFVDNKLSAGYPVGIPAALGINETAIYAFARSDGEQVGAYGLMSDDTLSADGDPVVHIGKHGDAGTWGGNPSRRFGRADQNRFHAFAAPGSVVPKAFNVLTGNIVVKAALNNKTALNVGSRVVIDGSATMRVAYY